MPICFEVPKEEAGIKLGVFLRRQGISMSLIRRVKFEPNGLQVNGQRVKTNHVLQEGQYVCVQLPMDEMSLQAQEMPLKIVYEDMHVMVINKPAGLVMHPTRSHKDGTLANGFSFLMQQRGCQYAFRPIGRLDANTSGLVLCAMNAGVAFRLASSLNKVYLAIVEGVICKDGTVMAPLLQREDSAILQCVHPNGKQSCTDYTVLAYNRDATLLAVRPKTGRTHQIRVHMAHLGHPLLGDDLYGGSMEKMGRHALHCAEISFYCFENKKQVFVLPMPCDMLACLQEGEWFYTPKGKVWETCQNFDIIV